MLLKPMGFVGSSYSNFHLLSHGKLMGNSKRSAFLVSLALQVNIDAGYFTYFVYMNFIPMNS